MFSRDNESYSHLLIFIKIYNHLSISVRFVKVTRVRVVRWREAAYLALSPLQYAEMRTSNTSYQVLLSVHSKTEQDWILLLQVEVAGARRELDSVVSSISISSSQGGLEAESLGQCDPWTAVYSVRTSRSLLSCPLTLTITPLYSLPTTTLFRLQPSLASLVGRDYLAHPKYALTCLHSYARTNNLYASKSIICDDTLQRIFGCVGIRLDRLWSETSKLLHRTEEERIEMSVELTDLDKEYRAIISLKTDAMNNLYPSYFSSSSQPSPLTKSVSINHSSNIYRLKKKSFKRSKSVDI